MRMRLIHCACASGVTVPGASTHSLDDVPTRRDLTFLDSLAASLLPGGTVPSLTEITSSASVPHMGEPALAGQSPSERLRVVVSGSDAALGAVLTRMMRADYMWAEVAYVPVDMGSPASVLWGLSDLSTADAVSLAVLGGVAPLPCIRTDSGVVVAGSAVIGSVDGGPYIGEVVVDQDVLLFNESASARVPGPYGARLVPTVGAPGLAAAQLATPASGVRRRFRRDVPPSVTDPSTVLSGRALQAGGPAISVTVDGVAAPRAVNRVTFYRHLRDIQAVRV
nr:Uncharacterised protein [Streptococcus thermophilus]